VDHIREHNIIFQVFMAVVVVILVSGLFGLLSRCSTFRKKVLPPSSVLK
jgi:hypothetical protein